MDSVVGIVLDYNIFQNRSRSSLDTNSIAAVTDGEVLNGHSMRTIYGDNSLAVAVNDCGALPFKSQVVSRNGNRFHTYVIWGKPGEIIDFVYIPVEPTEINGGAVMRTIVNDRVGNVEELFYDAGNRAVIQREFTGRMCENLRTPSPTLIPTAG